MKKKQTIRIELWKNEVLTDWTEFSLGRKSPDITKLIKDLIEFLEETLEGKIINDHQTSLKRME